MNIFVGNLSFDATEGDVKKLFVGFGNVASVAIVMRKEKKLPKSRGFGFVEMPDEQQALAAIAALNDKEFMGRVLNVDPARPPKVEAQAASELRQKRQPKVDAETEQYPREETEQKKTWFNPVFKKPGTYKGGRRTRSYVNKHGLSGMQEEAKPRRKSQENPMRWRKRKEQAKPWQHLALKDRRVRPSGQHLTLSDGKCAFSGQKSPGEHKPWKKNEGEAQPWKKAEGESKPWRKSEGGVKPWKKPAGDANPWSKSSERPQKSKGRRKPGGYKR